MGEVRNLGKFREAKQTQRELLEKHGTAAISVGAAQVLDAFARTVHKARNDPALGLDAEELEKHIASVDRRLERPVRRETPESRASREELARIKDLLLEMRNYRGHEQVHNAVAALKSRFRYWLRDAREHHDLKTPEF